MEGVKNGIYWGKNGIKMVYDKNNSKKRIFNCNLCLFTSRNKKDFIRHTQTNKHDTKWYISYNNHDCLIECRHCPDVWCDYITAEAHFDHFSHTKKNPKKTPTLSKVKTKEIVVEGYGITSVNRIACLKCGKSYKFKSGFYRHRKKCDLHIPNTNMAVSIVDNTVDTDNILALGSLTPEHTNMLLVNAIIKATDTNTKLCERIVALENTRPIVNNTITNINKQEFNINVFLNQECKNAMNLKDFLKSIKLNIDDLNYTAHNGYIKGITNIFLKNLEDIALNERPIHSIQDDTNHQFYIKDENKWECDDKDNKLQESIDSLTKRQINKIKDWELQHPNWEKSEQGIEEYMCIVHTIMGGENEKERLNNKDLIKKALINRVNLNTTAIHAA